MVRLRKLSTHEHMKIEITEAEAEAIQNAATWLKLLCDRDDGETDAHEGMTKDHQALKRIARKLGRASA